MHFTKEFFAFQLRIATALNRISGLPLPQILLDYTVLYRRIVGLRDYDANNPLWVKYLNGIDAAEDAAEWTWQAHIHCRDELGRGMFAKGQFGCFAYAQLNDGRIRLHFANSDPIEHSPLAKERLKIRRDELCHLIKHVKSNVNQPGNVIGLSWLYNIAAYRRIFPAAFTSNPQPSKPKFNSMTVWGQFMDRRGNTRSAACEKLLSKLQNLSEIEQLPSCFDILPLAVEAPIEAFYTECGNLKSPS